MKRFIYGIISGIGNIIPGLSGSAMLIIFNIYEDAIHAISNIFKKPKESLLFLFPLGIGIIIGTYSFANIINYVMNNYFIIANITFFAFLLATLPSIFKQANKQGFKKRYLIPFIIAFMLGLSLLIFKTQNIITITPNTFSLILIGIIISLSTIIPGISSTALLTIINAYNLYITALSNLDIKKLIPILLGFIFASFLISKLINYLFKNYYSYTYYAILGFTTSTIFSLLQINLKLDSNLLIGIIFGTIAFIITLKTFKKASI